MIHTERIHLLNQCQEKAGQYVLYWMQASQRAEDNHALEFAIDMANQKAVPVVAIFGLTDDFPDANLRHYAFMLEGLAETQHALHKRGIEFSILHDSPDRAALKFAEQACVVVTDSGYTRIQRKWRRAVAHKAPCPVYEVESDIIVPVETASHKEEYSAATLRRKLAKQQDRFLVPLQQRKVNKKSLGLISEGLDLQDIEGILRKLKIDRSAPAQSFYKGGTRQAKQWLADFINSKLNDYADSRNDPSLGLQSNLSPYLHFGQMSPLTVALEVKKARGKKKPSKDAFLEELIVRRELSINFVYYNENYDSYLCLPGWVRSTLARHAKDPRDYIYTRSRLETAQTHDPYWNAAMREMRVTGKMANYMRMYWGKKIIEWSPNPQTAFNRVLYFNNKYFLDGRDPNSFAGVAWCFGKHDRPWTERDIFGIVRYMNDAGLRRKFDIDAYVRKINQPTE